MAVVRVTYNGISSYYESDYEASLHTLSLVAFGAEGEVLVEVFDVPTGEYIDAVSEFIPYCIEHLN